MLKRLSELLFPPKCILCGKVLRDGEVDLCGECRREGPECHTVTRKIPFVESCTAVWYYEDPVRRSLLRYKFYGKRSYAGGYGRLLAMKLLQQENKFDRIAWVPVSRRRKLRRGYDQVELLAQAVCAELGTQSLCCLRKVRHNPPQSGITGQAQRRANVLGAYQVVEPEAFAGQRILLLDDIITTGATLSECARVLLSAGAEEVHCAAVAVVRNHKTNR